MALGIFLELVKIPPTVFIDHSLFFWGPMRIAQRLGLNACPENLFILASNETLKVEYGLSASYRPKEFLLLELYTGLFEDLSKGSCLACFPVLNSPANGKPP